MTKRNSNNSQIACKDNQLIQLRGQVIRRDSVTAVQQKIITYSASLVRPEDTPDKRYEMAITDFSELCGISTGGEIYKGIYREASNLQRKGLDLLTEDGDILIANFLVDTKISKKKGTVSFRLSENLLPFYKQYTGQFTRIALLDYMPMRGRYTLLLYELAFSWLAKGKVTYTVEDLRRLLDVPLGKYKRIVDLMNWVIHPAIKEINEKSTFLFIIGNEQKGKRNKVEAITFIIQKIQPIKSNRSNIVNTLVREGINSPTADSLVSIYSEERILANVNLAKDRARNGKIENLAAYITKAITEDYAGVESLSLFNGEEEESIKDYNSLVAAQLAALEEETAAGIISADSPFADTAKRLGLKVN